MRSGLDGLPKQLSSSSPVGALFLRAGRLFSTRSFCPAFLWISDPGFLNRYSSCFAAAVSARFVLGSHCLRPATMNPAPCAMPKAAALPARLLRAPRQCSNQGPSTSQVRGYHAPTASGAGRRLRETVQGQKKQHPAYVSSRVSGCGAILLLCGMKLTDFFPLLMIDFPYDCSPPGHAGSVQSSRGR